MLPEEIMENELNEISLQLAFSEQTKDYSEILHSAGLDYKISDYYLQVGEIVPVQGWILHISVVLPQLPALLNLVLPLLLQAKTPFKIPKSRQTANLLVSGMLGQTNLGKLITIYPDNESVGLSLAKRLITLTADFKGPEIPTDFHLGAILYTRYGAFKPIIQKGNDGGMYNCIYDKNGQLVPDNYYIPFMLQDGVSWPFDPIKSYSVPLQKKLLHNCIKPLAVLKHDVKGRVIKGLYIKNWLQARYCVVKEGKQSMSFDKWGRDIQDRLEWQYKLHNELASHIPMPKIIDHFREGNDLYLAMEFITGDSLDKIITTVYDSKSWRDLTVKNRLLLLDYLLQVIKIAEQLHEGGYVHRDLTSVNFICNKKGLYVIDLELAYDLHSGTPNPAFWPGTDGFTSPEQIANQTPTVKEDIYGLGALMIMIFTGIPPSKFETSIPENVKADLYFFIPEQHIVNLIAGCLHPDPLQRPTLMVIKDTVQTYRTQLTNSLNPPASSSYTAASEAALSAVINSALKGIGSELMAKQDGLWFSKVQNNVQGIANQQMSSATRRGWYEGIAGVLFMLARLRASGIAIDANLEKYYKTNFEYIRKTYLVNIENTYPGLFTGSAGMALMLAAGMDSGFIPPDETNMVYLYKCLDREPEGLDLANGAAGQGLALLQCQPYLAAEFTQHKLSALVNLLLAQQQKDGSWKLPGENGRAIHINGLGQGSAGIVLFLLMAGKQLKSEPAKQAVIKALEWYQKKVQKKNGIYTWPLDSTSSVTDKWTLHGTAGVALLFIKVYEILRIDNYKKAAEAVLNAYAPYISGRYLNHAYGLTGLGEVYLEAWRVFNDINWKQRADWITGVLIHQKKQKDGACYWLTDAFDVFPTADLLNGNSGIVYFLASNLLPGKLSNLLSPVVIK